MTRGTGRSTIGMVAAIAALLALTACAGDAARGDVASAGGDASPTAEGTEQESADEEAQALAFAECMRDNGFDMPDPGPGQEGLMTALREAMLSLDQSTVEEVFQEAFAACESLLPAFALPDHGQADDETMLALADCLRDQGLDVPDDLFSSGALHDIPRDELMAAMEQCRDVAGFGDER